MLESSKIKQRKFTNSFLLIVLAVIFCTFVALKIYQTMDDQQPVTLKNDEQASIAQDLQESNQAAWQNVAVDLQEVPPIKNDDHLLGQVEAPAQLIVYSDLTDPLAAGFLPIIHELKKQVGEAVVIAWRQHPLADNQLAREAAAAAECAGQQDKFWEFADNLAATASQEKPLDDWLAIAQNISLNLADFEKCLTKPEVQATIDRQSAEAQALGAIGVPSSFLNKTLLSGVYPLADFVSSDGQTKLGLLKLVQEAAGQVEKE
jgi:protein-disulfide isomerase